MSKLVTIKVKPSSKEKADKLKKLESFSSLSDTIEAMCSFFELNKISPKDGLNQGYQNSIFNVEKAVKMGLFEMKKQFTKDSQSMRKLMRALEKDHMINMSTKIAYLYDEKKEENVKNNVNNSFNSIVESSKEDLEKDREIELLKDALDDKNDEIKELKIAQNNGGNLAEKYAESLRIIYQQYQKEKSPLGKPKIVIDMTIEAFDKLFDL